MDDLHVRHWAAYKLIKDGWDGQFHLWLNHLAISEHARLIADPEFKGWGLYYFTS